MANKQVAVIIEQEDLADVESVLQDMGVFYETKGV